MSDPSASAGATTVSNQHEPPTPSNDPTTVSQEGGEEGESAAAESADSKAKNGSDPRSAEAEALDGGNGANKAVDETLPPQTVSSAADGTNEGSVDGEEAAGAESGVENAVEINGVPPNDVKNIILQVMSLYFDDEGGEDDAQRYDHIKAQSWIQLICDGIMEKLLAMRRPYKYVVHCMTMRKCGAGIHVCSSCYYSQADGWVNHAHDLSAHIYAVVSVYWSII